MSDAPSQNAAAQRPAMPDGLPQAASAESTLAAPLAAPQILIGWMTAPDKKTALLLAKAAVEAGLAACAQISEPVLSLYRWDGALCEETEYRITFKFTAEAEPQLRALLVERHPYEVPQWLAVPVSHVLPEYAKWVVESRSI